VILHRLCEAYGKLPSDYLGMTSPWGRWQMDEITLVIGRRADREDVKTTDAQQTYRTVGKGESVGYRSMAQGRPLKRVKIKPNGTW